ncbi:MAG: hypothetical protein H6R15_1090 [Proteobacteria bacterium]|nr:hypothetical protein [Pseudomonadota bacterium]
MSRRRNGRLGRWAALAALALSASMADAQANSDGLDPERLRLGQALYLDGRRSNGQPLRARRAGGLSLGGGEAACVNCHRRSGFGGAEGRSYIPPINAASLLTAKPPGSGASAAGRPAYTMQSLGRALRQGIDAAGRRLDFLMPRYDLNEAELAALFAYLARLSTQSSPGVTATVVDFATIVAPGMAAQHRQAMLDVLAACFAEHNAGRPAERGRRRLGPEIGFAGQRAWQLHVWELHGAPDTWEPQLAAHARRTPVFAVLGGLGSGQWGPVHNFCEANALPCLFPHIEVPGAETAGFYSMYLHKGIPLEAAIIAHDLGREGPAGQRVIQVRRAGDETARAAAEALRKRLSRHAIELDERVLDGADDAAFAAALAEIPATTALVLWLRPPDLRRLASRQPEAAKLYLSTLLADPESLALPVAWKERALIAYPYELPEMRTRHTAQLAAWLRRHALAPVAETLQADAYLACTLLATGMNEITGHLQPDYLLERLEVVIERTGSSGHYPRLALGAGQRFASKNGYLLRFADPASTRLVPVGERLAP